MYKIILTTPVLSARNFLVWLLVMICHMYFFTHELHCLILITFVPQMKVLPVRLAEGSSVLQSLHLLTLAYVFV